MSYCLRPRLTHLEYRLSEFTHKRLAADLFDCWRKCSQSLDEAGSMK
jgi:hypothetical protein